MPHRKINWNAKKELVPESNYEASIQLLEEQRRSSFMVSPLHRGDGKRITGTEKTDENVVCIHFMEPRSESSNETQLQPFKADEEKHSKVSVDSELKGVMAVAVPQNKEDGTKDRTGMQMTLLHFPGLGTIDIRESFTPEWRAVGEMMASGLISTL